MGGGVTAESAHRVYYEGEIPANTFQRRAPTRHGVDQLPHSISAFSSSSAVASMQIYDPHLQLPPSTPQHHKIAARSGA
eukprot:5349211-Pyramimonas_sp.AAC.1